MPIIKSAKKRVAQAKVRQARNYNTRTAVRKAIRAVDEAVKSGDKTGAETALTKAYKVIDTAAKKKVLQKNTASRRKSTLARKITNIKAEATPTVEAKETAKKPAAKKAAPKKTAAKAKAE